MKKEWTPLTVENPKEEMGDLIEIKWDSGSCVVKVVYEYQKKRLLMLSHSRGIFHESKYKLSLSTATKEFKKTALWRYVKKDRLMAYL